MNNLLCLKMLLCCVLATTSFQHEYTQAEPGETESTALEAVGRENPFEEVGSEKRKSLFERVFRSERPVEPAPELFVQTVTLKFLDAKNLKAALENMLSGYGTIAVDAKSNTLIISDNKENLERIIKQVREADRTPRQIVVEVVIVDVQLEDDTQIGVNWDILSDEFYDISYRQNFTDRMGSTIDSAANIGNATAFNTTGIGGDFALISGTVRNVVHLLQQKTNLEILASPKVMVVSGRKAEIRAVDEIPFNELIQTSEGGQLSATSFKDVGVTLKVTATLTEDNEIFLQVDTEQKVETGASETGVPVVDARIANTSLLLEDGQVVAIGGLRRRVTTESVDQIPFLGDLPIVGFLFRNTRTVEVNSELVVFLSPRIYKGEPLTQEQMSKFNELKGYPLLQIRRPRKKDLLPLVEMLDDANDK
ncbi:MAG: type II secretion system protein GspD [Planctomycetota bacterium]|nr:MAG: type II secretion system protein GspD [Planctomycetota bacterium]